jgi:signal transduction histidine kinase
MGDFYVAVIEHSMLVFGMLLFVFGAWLFYGRREGFRRLPLAGLMVTVFLWTLAVTLRLRAGDTVEALYWQRGEMFIAMFLPVFHYALAAAIVTGRQTERRLWRAALAPSAPLMALVFMTPAVVTLSGDTVVIGPGLPAFWVHYMIMMGMACVLVGRAFARLRTEYGSRLWYYVAGAALSLVAPLAAVYGGAYGWLDLGVWYCGLVVVANLATLAVAFAIVVPQEFTLRIRPVGGELFLLIVMLTFIAEAVMTGIFSGFLVRAAAMLAVVMYGVMSVRALSREVHELSSSEQLRSDLTISNQALRETDLTKTRLLSFASHQLRAILAGIRGYVDMLYRGDFGTLTDKQREITGVTLVAADRLGDTVEMFLDVAKIEGGRLTVVKRQVEMEGLINRAVREFVPLADRKGLALVRDVPEGLTAPVDEGKLYHAIANLIHNAINYTDKGGVEVAVRQDEDWLTVAVRDTGMGMDEAARRHVHELLERGLSAVRFEESGGSGLGLYIAKAVVEAHGGEMIAESSGRGLGSTFGFRLPTK